MATSRVAVPSRSAFAVLRTPRSSDDVVPSWVVHFLSEGGEAVLSAADMEGARRVLQDEQGWLVPASEGRLCLVRVVNPLVPKENGEYLHPSVSRSCSNETAAEAGRLSESQSLSTTVAKRLPARVDGIVPDGVRYVTVRFSGRESKRVGVLRNAYETVVVNPVSVSFVAEQAGRQQRYTIPLPSVAGAKHYSAPRHSG